MDFVREDDARAYLETLLDQYFKLYPEVRMRHIDGSSLRIDYIAIPRPFSGFPAQMIGIEVKRGFNGFQGFTAALKQCIDYRHGAITDSRSTKFNGQTPKWIFLFPSYQDTYTPVFEQGIRAEIDPDQLIAAAWRHGVQFASERLAGKFNVGVIRETKTWGLNREESIRQGIEVNGRVDCVQFSVSACRIWDSVQQASTQGVAWRADRGRGSA